MNTILSEGLILLAAGIVQGLVTTGYLAFLHSHPGTLEDLAEAKGGEEVLARKLKDDSTSLVLTFRAAKSISRLATLWAGTVLFTELQSTTSTWKPLLLLAGLAASALLGVCLELVVEVVIRRSPERWALRVAPVVAGIMLLLRPVTWLLGRLGDPITTNGTDRQHLITEEEIMTLVDVGEEEGFIEEDEKAMIYSIFQLGDTLCREVMVPRIDILAFREDTDLKDAADRLLETGYSRAPVYAGTIDNVIGLLYVKDLLSAWRGDDHDKPVSAIMRDAFFVPEAKKADDLLAEMQTKRVHMAVVVDEYGGTAGVVTIEDIVEEIVGEIRDEYDFAEESAFEQLQEGEYMFTGGIDLDDVNQITGAYLPTDNTETLAGFIYSQLGKVPAAGEIVQAGGLHLEVASVVGRRIRKVRATRIEQPGRESENHGNHN